MTKLYRPVGLEELGLIWDSGCREFPPRLPEQPIFYPVTSSEYASQIARDWNTRAAGFAGYVTSFEVGDLYLSDFDRHIVGSSVHEEYWIPAEQLPQFNRAMSSLIEVEGAFFGEPFAGFIPGKGGFAGKDAKQQFAVLARSRDYSGMDFVLEISLNQKAIFLNCLSWLEPNFSELGITTELKRAALAGVIQVWKSKNFRPGLPATFLDRAVT